MVRPRDCSSTASVKSGAPSGWTGSRVVDGAGFGKDPAVLDPPPEQPNHEIKISAARNEFEPFQIILRSDDADVESVDIDVTDLHGPGSLTLSKKTITTYIECYIDLKMPLSIEGRSGEWPDPLVPRVDTYDHEPRNAFPFKLVKTSQSIDLVRRVRAPS